MKILINCVSNYLNLLLINDEFKLIKSFYKPLNKNLTDIFIKNINHFLSDNNISIKEINSLYIVNGPGSFTSLKTVGVFSNLWKEIYKIKLFNIDFGQWNCTKKNEFIWWKEKNNYYYFIDSLFKVTKILKQKNLKLIDFKKTQKMKEKINFSKNWYFNINNFKEIKVFKPNYIKKTY